MTSRKFVLSLTFILLALCLAVQFLPYFEDEKAWITTASVLTSTFMYALMGNPLIMDYIKKYSRGRVSALQEAGKIIGELIGFILVFQLYKEGEGASGAFYVIAGLTLVVGLFVSCLLVKEKKITALYIIDPFGVTRLIRDEILDDDEDEEDDGIDIAKSVGVIWTGTMGCCGKIKTLTQQVWLTLKEDRVLWFAIYTSWVHKFMAYTFTTYFWLYMVSFVGQKFDGKEFEEKDALGLYGWSM